MYCYGSEGQPSTKWERYLRSMLPSVRHAEVVWAEDTFKYRWKPRHILPGLTVTVTLMGVALGLGPLLKRIDPVVALVVVHNAPMLVGMLIDHIAGWPAPLARTVFGFVGTAGITMHFLKRPNHCLHTEELHVYIEGAEDWSPSQRLRACLYFGIARINYFYPPMASVISRSVSAYVLMSQYMRVYRATGSREEALHFAMGMRAFSTQFRRRLVFVLLILFVLLLAGWGTSLLL